MIDLLTLFWLFVYFIVFLVVGGVVFFGLIFGAMYTKIPTGKLKKIIELGELTYAKTVYDLGAGLGTIAFEAAYSGAHVVAVEIDPVKVAAMKLLLRFNNSTAKAQLNAPPIPGLKSKSQFLFVDVVRSNISKVDLALADVVYCYLSPALMPLVAKKAMGEMKDGSKIISVEHKIVGWTPSFEDAKDKIYVYTIKKI